MVRPLENTPALMVPQGVAIVPQDVAAEAVQ
jgi:hypothetical protein